MQNINWKSIEQKAKKMTDEQLVGAIADCVETARVMGTGPMFGKDAGYYMDEASVYRTEHNRRNGR